ncbi:unnamed protein product [Rotaria magnacalcarata]
MSATVESSFNDLGTTVDPSSSGTSTSINHEKATTSSNWNGVVTACQCCDSSYFTDGGVLTELLMPLLHHIHILILVWITHKATTFYHVYYPLIKPYIYENDTLINEAQLNIRDDNEWNDEESTTEVNDNIFGDHAIIMIMSTRAYIYLWK